MLVLSRKVGEQIQIGDEITVTVVRIAGGNVRLGIEAPKTTPIAREELQETIQQEALEQQLPDQRHLVD
ncbi:MAG: carbon storage regulator CsrA [Pirellulaceae bacterium]